MQDNDWTKILGETIPDALKAVSKMEASIAPLLAQVNQHRDKIDPTLLGKFDEAMKDVSNAKEKLKEYGNINNK